VWLCLVQKTALRGVKMSFKLGLGDREQFGWWIRMIACREPNGEDCFSDK
jgi:hypothetical protein